MIFGFDIQKWLYYKDLIWVLTAKEVKIRYKSTIFGFLWSIANPLCFALVFFVAFKIFMRLQIPNYIAFLLSGLFPWQWFANSVNTSPTVFVSNASLIKKVKFPRISLPLAVVGNNLVHFLLSIPVLILVLIAHKIYPFSFKWIIGIIFLSFLTSLMIIGFSLIISSLNLFFRDLEHITMILTNLVFYCTPIIYSETMIPQRFRVFLFLNPLSPIIISWQKLFMEDAFSAEMVLVGSIWAVFVFFLGFVVYKNLEPKFAEVI